MEEYPEELRTPPVTLVSLVGCSELHASISTHLHTEQPPINTLALPDFSKITVIAKNQKESASFSSPPAGILKRDWLLKHRTRIPAVVGALFSSDHVSGDPAQWLQVCTDLENLKAVIQGRNIKLVLIVVVQSNSKINMSEDRMTALRKRAEVDAKYVINFVLDDGLELKHSLSRLGSTFAELANVYYRDEGRRVKTRLEKKSFSSLELNIRYCFKAAVYAEFRRDWVEALRLYEDAYRVLREMIGTSTRMPPIQRLVEIKIVAEQLYFKISTLLLHGGKITEAIMWFRQHNTSYSKLVGSTEVTFLHWEWLSRQFLVFAELLETSSATAHSISSPIVSGTADKPTEWEFYPSHYYQRKTNYGVMALHLIFDQLAAHYLMEKRSCLEFGLSMLESGNEIDGNGDSVVPSAYVGQFARLLEQGDTFEMQSLTDEEYTRYAMSEGKRFQDAFEIIAFLKKSFEAYSNMKAHRMASCCGFQMAREHFAMSEFDNAKRLFDDVANLYRQEGWVALLWEVLGYLRECSRKLGSVQGFIEYSLEMAALPVSSISGPRSFKDCGPAGPARLSQREEIHKEVFGLLRDKSGISSNEDKSILQISGDHPLHLEIDLVSPLRVVLLATAAFHEHIIKPDSSTSITMSLLSQLPYTVDIDQLEIQFNQSECNFIIVNGQRPQSAAISNIQPGHRVETAPCLSLATNKWLRLTYDIKSEQSGKLECIYVIARIGAHFSVCCRAESPASMNDLPLWKFEDRVESFPTKDPALSFSGQKATHVEEADPQVDLILGSSGPALVGESFIVPVTVASKGHAIYSGELKINLVDTIGGGLLSPREEEPFSTDDLHVELLGISERDESRTDTDNIRKVQHSFGLISVPFLNDGDSWSCNLEIRWHRPKPVMLYVSLGYSPQSNEPAAPKVHVHKNLQIEGKIAVVIAHRYMLPFRRDPLLLSTIKQADYDHLTSLPVNETSILVATAKNCTEVPLQILSMTIEVENDEMGKLCSVRERCQKLVDPTLLVPAEEFKKVFTITPISSHSQLQMGTVCLRWRRDFEQGDKADSSTVASEVVTRHRLPDVKVELPPLVVSLECPPHAILGNPFTYFVRIRNQTELLQEIKFSMADSQSFVLSGPHNNTIFILPKSEQILNYKLVPLICGSQQLPRVTITSLRYVTGLQPSIAASTIFVFPSTPHFELSDKAGKVEEISCN